MQAIINLKCLKAASNAASNEETRYYLKGVCVEISENDTVYIATDGHILFACDDAAETGNTLTGKWIIPSEIIKGVKLGRKLGETAVLTEGNGELTLRQDGAPAVTFRPIDGTFPDWRKVVPVKQAVPDINEIPQFNPALLARLQKAGDSFDAGLPIIRHGGPGDPALVTWNNFENLLGIIMPYPVKRENYCVPVWATPKAPLAKAA